MGSVVSIANVAWRLRFNLLADIVRLINLHIIIIIIILSAYYAPPIFFHFELVENF